MSRKSLPLSQSGVAQTSAPWYANVTAYQWLVLAIASAGWVFDAYEGQIFNVTRNQLLSDILQAGSTEADIKNYGDIFLAIFLVGGATGGILFGSLADRWGRRPLIMATILTYSLFSGLTYLVQSPWQVGALRFLVAMGVGGEWAVAASLVAEVFHKEARAHASGIFHATSVLGTWAAALAGLAVGAHWRYAYLIGIAPALLVFWVAACVKEPDRWQKAKGATEPLDRERRHPGRQVPEEQVSEAGPLQLAAKHADATDESGPKMGSLTDLLGQPKWRRHALLGMLLAAVGLGTFWAVAVAGQDLARELELRPLKTTLQKQGYNSQDLAKELKLHHKPALALAEHRSKFAYGIVQAIGVGLGLLSFGPLCVRVGRRRAFALLHVGACLIVPIACWLPQTYSELLLILPLFGFFTVGIHAGYAVYFPELFPTHLRATGAGFCFNGGRIVAALALVLSGWLKSLPGMDLRLAVSLLGLLFLLGLAIIFFMPETKGQPLPE